MKRLLVFGLSGQIGTALAPLLEAGGYSVLAISRHVRTDTAAIHWQQTSLETAPPWSADFDAVLSLGPIDAFADWLASRPAPASRVIAISSTSGQSKADVKDPVERALAASLVQAEARLRDACVAANRA